MLTSRIPPLNKNSVEDDRALFQRKVLDDFEEQAWPFNKILISKKDLDRYLSSLAAQNPGRGITTISSGYSYKKLCHLLEQLGGIHLRYNATVKRKTVNLNMWVMSDHELYLAMPRGVLLEEWEKAQ